LSAAELERLRRLTRPSRRRQFIAAHALLRRVSKKRGENAPALEITAAGAPRILARAEADPPRHVGIAHSGGWVAVALSEAPIGIDIETARRFSDPAAALDWTGWLGGPAAATTGDPMGESMNDPHAAVLAAWVAAEARAKLGAPCASPPWRARYGDLELAVAGTARPPLARLVDPRRNRYNSILLVWVRAA
jgi:hypothetical protein